jgi:Domain of unknown function DUF11
MGGRRAQVRGFLRKRWMVLATSAALVATGLGVVLAPAASRASSCGGYSGAPNNSSCIADIVTAAYPSSHTVKVGHRLFLLIVVSNNGPDNAVGQIKTVDLTSGALSVQWALTSEGYCDHFTKPPLEDCVLAYNLRPDESVAMTIVLVPKRTGTFTNRASSASLSQDPNPSNNVAKTTITVTS